MTTMMIFLLVVSVICVLISVLDEDTEIKSAFLLLSCLALFSSFLLFMDENNISNNNTMIEQCEKELPRNQKCVLIAVAEGIKGE